MNTNKLFVKLMSNCRKFYGFERLTRNVRYAPTASLSTTVNVSLSEIQKEKDTFVDVLPSIVDNLVSNPIFSQVPEVSSWVKQLLDYNLIGGKKSRGLATVFAYETLMKSEDMTEESLRKVRTVGWCVEMLQAYFLVVDDMMDGSSTRRGMPCWYRLPNVGLGAINDSILIQCSIFETLKANFGKTPMHLSLLDLFNEALLFTSMGQHLDYSMAHRNKNDYSLFTIERYYSIVKYKTSYYTFKLPVALGHYLADISDRKTHIMVEDICLEMGKLFQIQDDFLDCYGEESVIGKVGTDIQEGKCSWLAVNALKRCNEAQLSNFMENYANKDQAQVDRIKFLYEELSLPKIYEEEERAIYDSILRKCDALPNNAKTLFLRLLGMMYKRKQ